MFESEPETLSLDAVRVRVGIVAAERISIGSARSLPQIGVPAQHDSDLCFDQLGQTEQRIHASGFANDVVNLPVTAGVTKVDVILGREWLRPEAVVVDV